MRGVRTLVMVTALAASAACDPGWSVRATVLVTPAAQAAVATPAEMVVRMEELHDAGSGAARVTRFAIVCEPSSDPLELTWEFTGGGCPVPSRVLAWIRPLPEDAPVPPCGPLARPDEPALTEPGAFPRAGALVFADAARCEYRTDEAILEVDAE